MLTDRFVEIVSENQYNAIVEAKLGLYVNCLQL